MTVVDDIHENDLVAFLVDQPEGHLHRGDRYDHIFASQSLGVAKCGYLHSLREAGLSDHSPIEATFRPDTVKVS